MQRSHAFLAVRHARRRSAWFLLLLLIMLLSMPVHAAGSAFLLKDIGADWVGDCGYRNTLCAPSAVAINNELFFVADDGRNTGQIWKSDGTSAGTSLIKETNPIGTSRRPFALTRVAGALLFAGDDDTHGFELWRSDGTTGGTSLVMDINPGAADGLTICPGRSCLASQFVAINETLFFTATDGHYGFELWKTNGTAAGTILVKDINPGTSDSFPAELINMDGTLFFRALDAQGQEVLWKSDGTTEGTVQVAAIAATNLLNVNGTLFFSTIDVQSGSAVWKSDGTPSGTQLIAPVLGLHLTDVKGTIFFEGAVEPSAGGLDFQLWKTDGTTEGTTVVANINPNPIGDTEIADLTNVNGTLFFTAVDATFDQELWKSDGTLSGTMQLTHNPPIPPYSASYTGGLVSINGRLFFTASDGVHGYELWTSDGTEEGTAMVQDIAPNAQDAWPSIVGAAGTYVFISVMNHDNRSGAALWAMRRPMSKVFVPLMER